MRVLHVNDYPLEAGGGAEVLLARTVALLRAEGAEVDVFSAADLPDRRLTVRRYLDNPVARRALADRLAAFRPDVVHLHNYYHVLSPGVLAAVARYKRRHPARVVMTAHDYHLVCPNSGGNCYRPGGAARPLDGDRLPSLGYLATHCWDQRGPAYSLLKLAQHWLHYRWRARQRVFDAVLCPSRFLENLVRRVVPRTYLLPHPAPPPRLPTGPRDGPLRLVFAGRLEPEKGLAEFLEMLPASFAGTLTVIGDGRERERCIALCQRRGLENRVEWRGRLSHEQTVAAIARGHVLVAPSRCLESYGLTLIEALSAGTNVLASDRGALRELVTAAGVGFLFDPEDAESLRIQLERIERDHRAGTLNRFDVSAFLKERSESAYVQKLLAVYQN